ncbi:MAG TPA: protein translocase subunit SecD, partial [Acidimicrobiales bacterium]|nr:protein translocase subunit SecD [Acidimicrobiales bacterium]
MRKRPLVISLVVSVLIAVIALAATLGSGWSPKLGLDLAGGSEVVYQPAHKISTAQMNNTINIIRNRVDATGVSGATVDSQGGNVVVQLPGIRNPQAVINLIGETAQLQFRPVLCLAGGYTPAKGATPPTTVPSNCSSPQYQQTAANLNVNATTQAPSNNVPADPALAAYPSSTPEYNDSHADSNVLVPASPDSGQAGLRYLLGPTGVLGTAVAPGSAQAVLNGSSWVVDVSLTGKGATAWDALAQQQFHAYIAIDLDGLVQSAPLTQPSQSSFTSFQGKIQISGNFTQATAQNLALVLNYGALPVQLHRIDQTTVSPTLGKSSLKAGLLAGLGGLLLVLLYTIFYYRALGIVVFSGLLLTAGLLWAIVSALGHTSLNVTLDLAGVTGLIVSVGITVDSYIVYFERLKDEARAGRSVRTSVDKSFRGAFRTVLAADLVSLAAAVILWLLSVGTVRGFAFFLGLST